MAPTTRAYVRAARTSSATGTHSGVAWARVPSTPCRTTGSPGQLHEVVDVAGDLDSLEWQRSPGDRCCLAPERRHEWIVGIDPEGLAAAMRNDVNGKTLFLGDLSGDRFELVPRGLERARRGIAARAVDSGRDGDPVVQVAAPNRADEERLAADQGIGECPSSRPFAKELHEPMGRHDRVGSAGVGQQLVRGLAGPVQVNLEDQRALAGDRQELGAARRR